MIENYKGNVEQWKNFGSLYNVGWVVLICVWVWTVGVLPGLQEWLYQHISTRNFYYMQYICRG